MRSEGQQTDWVMLESAMADPKFVRAAERCVLQYSKIQVKMLTLKLCQLKTPRDFSEQQEIWLGGEGRFLRPSPPSSFWHVLRALPCNIPADALRCGSLHGALPRRASPWSALVVRRPALASGTSQGREETRGS